MIIRRVLSGTIAVTFLAILAPLATAQVSNLSVRATSANITSGNNSSYEQAGIDIFKALKPDVVAIQEFNYNGSTNNTDTRALVDAAFGTNYHYFRETKAGYSIPNGIVSRWPIIGSGSWTDPLPTLTQRGFAWAQIDLPGTNDLYVVSVHLYSGGSEAERNTEAIAVRSNILANFPTNAWVIVGGDFNTPSRGEDAVLTLKTIVSDAPIPADKNGDQDTNAGRNEPYDYLLPSFSLTNKLVPVVMPSNTFSNGLVFDTRVYTPTNDLLPAVATNSGAFQMQHMAVAKNFLLPVFETNGAPIAPSIVTHPQSQTNTVGTPVDFFVAASGTAPLAYQWRLNGTNLSGATATNYAIASVQATNAGDYTVIVTNLAGGVTSSIATLTVTIPPTNTPPNITVNPASTTNLAGTTANFSVTATGTDPLSYQWRFNGTNISATATNSTYSKSNVQTNDAGPYTVVITNIAGSVTSTVAMLTVTLANTNSFTGVMVGWDVSAVTNFGISPLLPTTNITEVTVQGLTRGAGLTTVPSAAARAWGANGFDIASTTAAAAIAANDFATFAIEASAGFQVSFSSVSRFDYRRSSTGPANGVLQYQIGAGAFTDITNLAYTVTTSGGGQLPAIDLSNIPALQNIGPGTNVTFRIVNFGSSNAGGTWYVYDFANTTAPDLAITGTIAPIAPPSGPPAVAPTLSTPSLSGNQFIFQLTGTATSNYVVQVSTNLALTNWLSLQTNPAPFWFTNDIGQPQQFFRGTVAP